MNVQLHQGMNRRDLWLYVRETGGKVEQIHRTGEYRIRYAHMPKPSGPANGRRKDVNKYIVSYVRKAVESFPKSPAAPTTPVEAAPSVEVPVIAAVQEVTEVKNRPFGEVLAEARKAENISPKALAELLGMHHNTIRNIESGFRRPSANLYEKIADVLPGIRTMYQPDGLRSYKPGKSPQKRRVEPKPIAGPVAESHDVAGSLGAIYGRSLATLAKAQAKFKAAEKELAAAADFVALSAQGVEDAKKALHDAVGKE